MLCLHRVRRHSSKQSLAEYYRFINSTNLGTDTLEVWLVHSEMKNKLQLKIEFLEISQGQFDIPGFGKQMKNLYLQSSTLSSVSVSQPAQKGERPPETIMKTST